jgi:septum formation protein
MKMAGIQFEIRNTNFQEILPEFMLPESIPEYFAEQKALSIKDNLANDELLITADTMVLLENQILGKPKDRNDAFNMLQTLSGKMHKVITGVCIMTNNYKTVFADTTRVWFKLFNLNELEYYLDHYPVMDKAGAYGAQDWLGLVGIEKIEGSYFNVMGLPIHKVYNTLSYLSNK